MAYGAVGKALYVTAASGWPPNMVAELLKVDPVTLQVVARVSLKEAGFGIVADDVNGTLWVTNTAGNAVAVYAQSDLSLRRQFPAESAVHPRDAAVTATGKFYVSQVGGKGVSVFDGKTLEPLKEITIESTKFRGKFSGSGGQYDSVTGKVHAVSMESAELAIIDPATDTVEKVIALPLSTAPMTVAFDAQTGRFFVPGQGSDNLLVVDAASGAVVADVPVGAGALSAVFEPINRLVYVANRTAGTLTVLDPDGVIVANLDAGPFPNHVIADGKGNVFLVNKDSWQGAPDPKGDRIARISRKL